MEKRQELKCNYKTQKHKRNVGLEGYYDMRWSDKYYKISYVFNLLLCLTCWLVNNFWDNP